jgi:hypothetical protein
LTALEFLACLLAFLAVVTLLAHGFTKTAKAIDVAAVRLGASADVLGSYCDFVYFNWHSADAPFASEARNASCFSPETRQKAGTLEVSGVRRWFP